MGRDKAGVNETGGWVKEGMVSRERWMERGGSWDGSVEEDEGGAAVNQPVTSRLLFNYLHVSSN